MFQNSSRWHPRHSAPQVEAWLSGQDGMQLYFTAVGEAELRRGVAILPVGRRRSALAVAVDVILEKDLQGRILPFDRAAGRPISQFDCQIAAIAKARDAALATRNIRDFEGCGVDLVDPWQGTGL